MSGRYVRLQPGRYILHVENGAGPAGVQRGEEDPDVALGIAGGHVEFAVSAPERAFYWWRGPHKPSEVRLLGVSAEARARSMGPLPPQDMAG
jgi:hypothetical protein